MSSATANYTTKIPVVQTVAELQSLLVEHGADHVMIRTADRQPIAVSFTLDLGGSGPDGFTLPIDVDRMRERLRRQHREGKLKSISAATASDPAHAARVAWRVVKDWLVYSLALVEAGQAEIGEVLLPYLVVDADGTTLYARFVESAGSRAALVSSSRP